MFSVWKKSPSVLLRPPPRDPAIGGSRLSSFAACVRNPHFPSLLLAACLVAEAR